MGSNRQNIHAFTATAEGWDRLAQGKAPWSPGVDGLHAVDPERTGRSSILLSAKGSRGGSEGMVPRGAQLYDLIEGSLEPMERTSLGSVSLKTTP